MRKYSIDAHRVHHSIRLVVTLFVLLGFLVQNVAGSAYYSLLMESNTAVTSPPIVLQEGNAGNSTIFANSTSAKVSTGSGDFNYVLNMTENHGSDWRIRLKAYDDSNIARLNNCAIYIYNSSNSTQIVILSGVYDQQTGFWYDLAASDTEYIWMHVETSGAGTSYIYAYLEILVPGTITYAQYIITFKTTQS
jgi:hypothetical protein